MHVHIGVEKGYIRLVEHFLRLFTPDRVVHCHGIHDKAVYLFFIFLILILILVPQPISLPCYKQQHGDQ